MKRTDWFSRKGNSQATRRPTCRPAIELLESRCLLNATATEFRPISEIGNNIANPDLGTANTALLRISPAAYRPVENGGDGLNTPSMNGNAPFFVQGSRLVSNVVSDQADPNNPGQDFDTANQNNLSAFGYTFGQFLDHDMSLTPDNGTNDFPIPPDARGNDPIGSLRFGRSLFDPTTGITTPREQINVNTAYLDLSQVYGSTDAVAAALRTFSGGQLKSSPGADGKIGTKDDLLPYNNTTYFTTAEIGLLHMANDAHIVASTELFAAGDVRANETIELTSLHTLFLRNHNSIARELKSNHRNWGDEQLYQEARKINIAQMQIITYEAYLPALLGEDAMPVYVGYDASVDPTISNEFSTVAFRFGHSLLNNEILRHNNKGVDVADPTGSATVRLAETFFNPRLLTPGGVIDPITGHVSTDIGAVLKGDADAIAQAMDVYAVSDIRNLLFGNGAQGGEDLIARDLWRAHDHGIGTYNQVRVAFGLAPITTFAEITSDPEVQARLEEAYVTLKPTFAENGKNAGDIDPFAAGMAEDHVPGSNMGPLFTRILVDQFTRLRDGDRFFYLNQSWTAEERKLLKKGDTLGELITSHTEISNLQKDVFKFEASISGKVTVTSDSRRDDGRGAAGITVQLVDANGQVVGIAVTDNQGRYSFDQQTGVGTTGVYRVVVVVPDGFEEVKPESRDVRVTAGGAKVKNVNFRLEALDTDNDCGRPRR